MYQIGQTSQITKISTRMLRYYDTENILKPSLIQPNGYRFYSDSDIEMIMQIKQLRRYHFSYAEIKDLVSTYKYIPKKIFLKKLAELKQTLDNYELLVAELEHTYDSSSTQKICNTYDISLVHKYPFNALCQKKLVTEYTLETFLDSVITKIDSSSFCLTGKYFLIFYTYPDDAQTSFEIEYCQPIAEEVTLSSFKFKVFSASLYISTLHYGPYETIHLAYEQIYKWAANNNFSIQEPFMERYYVDSSYLSDCNEFITEVFVSVSK